MALDFEVVERPRGGGSIPDKLIDALKETLTNGKAVRLLLSDQGQFTNWQATVRARLRTEHNLRLRTKFNKLNRQVTAWVERFDDRATEEFTDTALGVSEDNVGVRPAPTKS